MFLKKSAFILAKCALFCSVICTNCICTFSFYEPEQPEELERLKINSCL